MARKPRAKPVRREFPRLRRRVSKEERIGLMNKGRERMASFEEARRKGEKELMRLYLFDAGKYFAHARYVQGTAEVLRVLGEERERLLAEKSKTSKMEAEVIVRRMNAIKRISRVRWQQSGRGIPKQLA